MNNVNSKTVTKSLVIISTLAVISMLTISVLPFGRSSAFDLGLISKDTNIGSIDTKSLFSCFGAAITCDNDNTVNNNVSVNNDTNNDGSGGNDPGTLTVSKQIRCESTGGSPSNTAVCEYAINSINYPAPEDFPITVIGNNPNPSIFQGSITGTPVSIGPGNYEINEEINENTINLIPLDEELDASISVQPSDTIGDCKFGTTNNPVATGVMSSGGSQECVIVNTILINGGTVPSGAPGI